MSQAGLFLVLMLIGFAMVNHHPGGGRHGGADVATVESFEQSQVGQRCFSSFLLLLQMFETPCSWCLLPWLVKCLFILVVADSAALLVVGVGIVLFFWIRHGLEWFD